MEVRECVSYAIYKVNVNYLGPFNTTTSFPLLIVGNTAGMSFALPCKCWLICARSCNAAHEVIFLTDKYILFHSIHSAVKAAQGFSGSSLLTVNTPGVSLFSSAGS